eukprot:12262348-Alexandrium_andersonii.AAC.1
MGQRPGASPSQAPWLEAPNSPPAHLRNLALVAMPVRHAVPVKEMTPDSDIAYTLTLRAMR